MKQQRPAPPRAPENQSYSSLRKDSSSVVSSPPYLLTKATSEVSTSMSVGGVRSVREADVVRRTPLCPLPLRGTSSPHHLAQVTKSPRGGGAEGGGGTTLSSPLTGRSSKKFASKTRAGRRSERPSRSATASSRLCGGGGGGGGGGWGERRGIVGKRGGARADCQRPNSNEKIDRKVFCIS